MSITESFANITASDASTTTVTSATFDSTSFTHLVVWDKHEGATTTATPSDNKSSTGWSSLTKEDHTNGDITSQMHWVKIETPGTGHTVTMTFGAARPFKRLAVWLVNSTSGEISLVAQANAEGSSAAPDAGSLATGADATVSFMAVGEYALADFTPSTGWTEDFDPQAIFGFTSFGASRSDASGTLDPACTCTVTMDWTANAASFKELIAAAAYAHVTMPPMRPAGRR